MPPPFWISTHVLDSKLKYLSPVFQVGRLILFPALRNLREVGWIYSHGYATSTLSASTS